MSKTTTNKKNHEYYFGMTFDDFCQQKGVPLRMREIVFKAIEEQWGVGEIMSVIKRELSLLQTEFVFLEKKAHDELVRRERGVDGLAIIRTADYERCLFISTVLNPKVSEKENLYSPQQESQ